MFRHAPFLGQVLLTVSPVHPGLGQMFGPCDTLQRFMQQVAQSIAYANRAAQQALARGDNNGAGSWAEHANKLSKEWEMWKKKYDDCLRMQPVSPMTPVTPEPPRPGGGSSYPVTYPWNLPSELPPPVPTGDKGQPPIPPPYRQGGYRYPWSEPLPPPPVPTEDKPPYRPFSPRNIPEGAYNPVPTPSSGQEQGFQGLPCPEGQYRPPGAGWCVPKPVATAYRGIPTVPYGSLFSGGFFGGGQGVSATSFT